MRIGIFAAVVMVGLSAMGKANAEPEKFVFGQGSPAQQIAQIESVTDFETFTGRTHKISGTVTIDRAKKTASGAITIPMATVDTGIPLRDEHMRSANWMDAEKFPEASFALKTAKRLDGDNFSATGDFTLHGVTKRITVPMTAKYLPSSDTTRKAGFKNDVLFLKAKFPIRLTDYAVDISKGGGKVANEVTISITAFGVKE